MTTSQELRALPGILWVAIGAALGLVVFGLSIATLSRTEHLEQRVKQADSTAVVQTFAAVIWHRDAVAARAAADSVRRWADSAITAAAAARTDVATKVARAAAARARVDTAGLRADVLQALADADTLRLAVTPALAADSVVIAAVTARAVRLEVAYALLDSAYQAQSAALAARTDEVHALEQRHAPRCGWKCGAALGVTTAAVAPKLVEQLLALLFPGRR